MSVIYELWLAKEIEGRNRGLILALFHVWRDSCRTRDVYVCVCVCVCVYWKRSVRVSNCASLENKSTVFDVLLTVHLSIFISVINQLDVQNICFTISLFHAFVCFEHMCSKHVEAWNKLIVKQKFCASSLLITEIKQVYSVTTVPSRSLLFVIMKYWCRGLFRGKPPSSRRH